ncbi:MAG: hypothetical protein ACI9KE_002197 [Polyangiales bacterium]|jgi:hypothetical protein
MQTTGVGTGRFSTSPVPRAPAALRLFAPQHTVWPLLRRRRSCPRDGAKDRPDIVRLGRDGGDRMAAWQ